LQVYSAVADMDEKALAGKEAKETKKKETTEKEATSCNVAEKFAPARVASESIGAVQAEAKSSEKEATDTDEADWAAAEKAALGRVAVDDEAEWAAAEKAAMAKLELEALWAAAQKDAFAKVAEERTGDGQAGAETIAVDNAAGESDEKAPMHNDVSEKEAVEKDEAARLTAETNTLRGGAAERSTAAQAEPEMTDENDEKAGGEKDANQKETAENDAKYAGAEEVALANMAAGNADIIQGETVTIAAGLVAGQTVDAAISDAVEWATAEQVALSRAAAERTGASTAAVCRQNAAVETVDAAISLVKSRAVAVDEKSSVEQTKVHCENDAILKESEAWAEAEKAALERAAAEQIGDKEVGSESITEKENMPVHGTLDSNLAKTMEDEKNVAPVAKELEVEKKEVPAVPDDVAFSETASKELEVTRTATASRGLLATPISSITAQRASDEREAAEKVLVIEAERTGMDETILQKPAIGKVAQDETSAAEAATAQQSAELIERIAVAPGIADEATTQDIDASRASDERDAAEWVREAAAHDVAALRAVDEREAAEWVVAEVPEAAAVVAARVADEREAAEWVLSNGTIAGAQQPTVEGAAVEAVSAEVAAQRAEDERQAAEWVALQGVAAAVEKDTAGKASERAADNSRSAMILPPFVASP